jgi:mannitol/fructose-specific phosphotransferase system IIA component (Ntr-type)
LIAQLARGGFLIPELLILVHEGAEGTGQRSSMEHLRANRLFGAAIDLAQWDRWVDRDEVRDRRLVVPADFADDPSRLLGTTGNGSTLILALVRSGETLPYHSDEKIEPGDELIVLDHVTEPPPARDRFDRLVIDAPVLDLQEPATLDQVFGMVAERLTDRLGVSADELRRILWKRERTASSVLVPGLAVPHIVIEGSGKHDLLIARSRPGIQFDGQSEPVHAVFVLVTTSDLRNVHLGVLSALAQVVSQVDAFEEKWRRADGEHALRTLLLASTRSRFA